MEDMEKDQSGDRCLSWSRIWDVENVSNDGRRFDSDEIAVFRDIEEANEWLEAET